MDNESSSNKRDHIILKKGAGREYNLFRESKCKDRSNVHYKGEIIKKVH